MSKACQYALKKIYTSCNKLGGMKIAPGGTTQYKSDLRYRKNISIGRNSTLYKCQNIYISKKGRFSMGDESHVAPYGYFLIEEMSIEIGQDVAIGPYCSFFCKSNSHKPDPLFRKNFERGDIIIGNNVFIGAQSVILPGTEIGDNVIIGANSVVKGKLDANHFYAGSPCKRIKSLS